MKQIHPLAVRLWQLRQDHRMTQDELSVRCGIGPKTLSTLESGARTETIRVSQLVAILAAYGLTVADVANCLTFPKKSRTWQHANNVHASYCDCDQHVCSNLRRRPQPLCDSCFVGMCQIARRTA